MVKGKTIAYHSAKVPVTAKSLLDGIVNSGAEVANMVPYSIKLLSEYPGALEVLRKLKALQCSGTGCPEVLGGKLVEEGISLVQYYGRLAEAFQVLNPLSWF